ncbi:MAG: sulfatase-like hydrolase/transferase [Alphaproteobacteria bacterium]|nr:sulfatase-like hydrolase/transferase [Alphaproteobacteria bacterium]
MRATPTLTRRSFLKTAGAAGVAAGSGLFGAGPIAAQPRKRHNILFVLTDQERHFRDDELPSGFRLPGHERLVRAGVTFQNHQVASCVCTPSRSVVYTGQHIQHTGMFDNTNFPWAGSMSTEIDTVGDMLRARGYYTAYKGKWHLTEEFETANDLHAPRQILGAEMEAYGFADYTGIGDIIAHTRGGYLHDDVITAMSRSWLRGQGLDLHRDGKPWFLAVNLVNPHDVMYYNTDVPGERIQNDATLLMEINREPRLPLYQRRWDHPLPLSRNQALDAPGRPRAHADYRGSRAALVGAVPNEDARWRRLNDYYLNCIADADRHLVSLLDELAALELADDTVVVYTADHGELAGAHGLSGKGATAYREQTHVPLIIAHPDYPGGRQCNAVTSHVDIAATLAGLAGGGAGPDLARSPGKDLTTLLDDPGAAGLDAVRPGALYNYNMLAYLDQNLLGSVAKFLADGGKPADIPAQGYRPDLRKRGAIRAVYDGRYKLARYFSPEEHHMPRTLEDLLARNDVELFDLETDPQEMTNLVLDQQANGALLLAMNDKLNALIEDEVGEDLGQMLPGDDPARWRLDPNIHKVNM